MSKFWKEIAPENWKLHTKKKKEKKTLERAKSECTNPFHFLVKHSDLAHRMPTPCPCSRVVTKKPFHKFVDLRDVFKPLPLNTDEKQLVVLPSPARSGITGLRSYKLVRISFEVLMTEVKLHLLNDIHCTFIDESFYLFLFFIYFLFISIFYIFI